MSWAIGGAAVQVFETDQPQTPIHRIDPRVRIVTALVFAVVVCVSGNPIVLVAGLGMGVLVLVAARVRGAQVFRRLSALNLFMLVLALSLPLFTPGTPLLRLGPFTWSAEGLWRVTVIASRANAIMIALIGLLGAMEPAHFGFALSRLGVPRKLVHVLLFMVRYVEVIHPEYHRLRNAMRVRGFRPHFNRHTFRALGYLIGLLLVRALDRGERVIEAMKCRGFRGRLYVLAPFRIKRGDIAFAVAAAIGIAFLAWAEIAGVSFPKEPSFLAVQHPERFER